MPCQHQNPPKFHPAHPLACAFGCYQRTLALYQDSFYIICYHYMASNQICYYYCCSHLAGYGTPTPSLGGHISLLGSTFLMLSLNFLRCYRNHHVLTDVWRQRFPHLSHLLAKLVSIVLNLSPLSVNSSNYPQFRSQYLVNYLRKILTSLLEEENHTDLFCSPKAARTPCLTCSPLLSFGLHSKNQ